MSKADEGRQTLLDMLGETAHLAADDVIRAITYCEIGVKPVIPLALVAARPDEFKDRFLAELALSAAEIGRREADAPDDRHSYFLQTFALYFLALWQDTRAYRPLVAYLSGDHAMVDAQLGDIVTEDLPGIIARVYDGSDLAPLKAIIEDPQGDEFIRGACLGSLDVMARMRKLARQEVNSYFSSLAEKKSGPDEFIPHLVYTLAHTQDPSLRPVIDRLFKLSPADELILKPIDIDAIYAAAPGELDDELIQHDRFNAIIDYLLDWSWFHASEPEDLAIGHRDGDDETIEDVLAWQMRQPVARPTAKVGRNDPCPCGSGKKYKKCCLNDTPA